MDPEQPTSILTALQGQSILLPDLNSVFHSWPKEINPNLDQLRRDVDEWLDRYNTTKLLYARSFHTKLY